VRGGQVMTGKPRRTSDLTRAHGGLRPAGSVDDDAGRWMDV